jgi:hypothetical protein
MKIVDPVCGVAMDEKDIFETSLFFLTMEFK